MRCISSCVGGFILSIIIHCIFFYHGDRSDIIVWVAMFLLYCILLGYSLLVENILYFVYKKNNLNAFLVTYSLPLIYVLFYCFTADKYDRLINITVTSVFFALQIGIFYYHQRRMANIEK